MSHDEPVFDEERLRKQVEKRIAERQEEFLGVAIHLAIYVAMNVLFFSAAGAPALVVSFFWGIGMFAHGWSYWTEHGPGRDYRERLIDREVERERQRLYGYMPDKAKNDDLYIDDDGEIRSRHER
jgi:hypothetical protein